MVLLNEHLYKIKIIYEINPNKFIFCTKRETDYMFRIHNTSVVIELIELKKITEKEINDKLEKLNENNTHPCSYYYYIDIFDDKEEKEKAKMLIYLSFFNFCYKNIRINCAFYGDEV